jgi:hypothetical protein
MNFSNTMKTRWIPIVAYAVLMHGAASSAKEITDPKVEFKKGDTTVFGWQKEPLGEPKGGPKFTVSAFVHPLATPGGFVCTTIQPSDHLHHLGLWWPWKYIEADGKIINTWEIQEGQGAHAARSMKELSRTPDSVVWEVSNETVVKTGDAGPKVAIQETGRITLSLRDDATVLDIALDQKAVGSPVVIKKNHYSGFSWRGPEAWNKDNSTMLSSEGKGRDNANGTPARWLVVSGASPKGTASVLILSKAQKLAGTPEKLRVWDSKNHNGAPFVNFNPVYDKPLPLDDANPAVSKRSYRVIAADRVIGAAEAEEEWKKWTAD